MCSVSGGLVFFSFLSGLLWVVAIATENTWYLFSPSSPPLPPPKLPNPPYSFFHLNRRFSRFMASTYGEKEIDYRPYMPREIFYHLVAWLLPLAFYIELVVDDKVGLGRFIGYVEIPPLCARFREYPNFVQKICYF